MGVLHARKHLAAYTKGMRGGAAFRERVNQLESIEAAVAAVEAFFDEAGRDALSDVRRPDAA